jgi:hypothetical protein
MEWKQMCVSRNGKERGRGKKTGMGEREKDEEMK